ncbi:MAG: agmatine deiminase, partial [Firmicutes bacterium]|nr:agmatine deiminase [Bacillota bacterium]
MKTKLSCPSKDGYFMPAEFSTHDGTLMLMPYRGDVWRNQAKEAQEVFFKIAKEIAKFEPVFIGVHSTIWPQFEKTKSKNITFFQVDYDDAWVRDTGPTFIKNNLNEFRTIDWQFNAYGGKEFGLYSPWQLDDALAQKLSTRYQVDSYRTDDFVMEGGAFHVDGEGLVMATEYNLLHKGRNPKLTKKQIEAKLLDMLGGKKMIWLPRGIYNDETKEHVDNVATFIGPGHVLVAEAVDPRDAQQPLSQATVLALKSQTDTNGKPLKITTVVMPKAIHRTYFESAGLTPTPTSKNRPMNERLAASYLNLYFVNGAVIVPKFNQKTDDIALQQLKDALPGRKIIMLDTKEVLLGGGNIHCITQQIPKGVL